MKGFIVWVKEALVFLSYSGELCDEYPEAEIFNNKSAAIRAGQALNQPFEVLRNYALDSETVVYPEQVEESVI